MLKSWFDDAWDDYLYWQKNGDKKTIRKINKLIKDIERHPFTGIGKPEPLKFNLSGKWSRRINHEHRLIYLVDSQTIYIFSCRDYYNN